MKKILFIVCAAATQFLSAQVLEKVNFVGALHRDASKDWTKGWTEWNPKNATYGDVTDSTTLNDASSIKKISSTITLDAKTVYLLRSMLVVESGGKLIIPAGTVIRGQADLTKTPKNYATIVVERGGMIDIQGTNTKPVVLTSSKAAGSRDRGDWGGLVICGKAVNNQGTDVQLEGFNNVSVNNALGKFGGSDDKDNSGSIKYVRIEFAGLAFEPNKEVNSLTMGSVGSATTIEGVQTSFGNDDAFEWFGGTVNCKYLVVYRALDDDFDTDNGYSGNVQFGLAVRDPQIADNPSISTSEGFESDNNDAPTNGVFPNYYTSPRTRAVFSNITSIGPRAAYNGTLASGFKAISNGDGGKGARIRRGSQLSIMNSVFAGWGVGLFVDGSESATGQNSDSSEFRNNIFGHMTASNATNTPFLLGSGAFATISNLRTWFAARNNDTTTLANLGLTGLDISSPMTKLIPTSGSKQLTGASFTSSKLTNSFLLQYLIKELLVLQTGLKDGPIGIQSMQIIQ